MQLHECLEGAGSSGQQAREQVQPGPPLQTCPVLLMLCAADVRGLSSWTHGGHSTVLREDTQR